MEAEAAASPFAMRNGLFATRNGQTPRSESCLSADKGALDDPERRTITRAGNAIETARGSSARVLWNAKDTA